MKVKQVPREVAWRRRKRWSKAASPPSHPTAGVQLGKLESDPAGKVCKAPGAGTKASTAELSRLCLCSLPSSFPIQSIPRVLLSAQKKHQNTIDPLVLLHGREFGRAFALGKQKEYLQFLATAVWHEC